jgi:glycine cleavage system H protein
MRCPFIQESRVRFCKAAPGAKIPSGEACVAHDRCSTPACIECPVARQVLWGREQVFRCPLLEETVAQYCAAADVRQFIPRNDALLSRCHSEAHRYCSSYLKRMHPEAEVDVPERLAFAANHMWLDAADDGTCHVGLDAFFARAIGRVEQVSLLAAGLQRPTAVLTVNGVDLTLVFPNALLITDANVHLRVEPERLTQDPYGAGWLFAGQDLAHQSGDAGLRAEAGLLRGTQAAAWMRLETDRMSRFAREELRAHAAGSDGDFLMDGGAPVVNLGLQLDREGLLHLFHEFFAPQRDWRR